MSVMNVSECPSHGPYVDGDKPEGCWLCRMEDTVVVTAPGPSLRSPSIELSLGTVFDAFFARLRKHEADAKAARLKKKPKVRIVRRKV